MSLTKVQRLRKIKSLIRNRKEEVQSADDLLKKLRNAGFDVDKETVENDIKELGIVEVSTESGKKLAFPPTARVKNVRIAPRKARLVVDLIRGKTVDEALSILRFTPKAASPIVEKVLKSAVANAEHNYKMDASDLVVEKAYVDEGPTLKRYIPRARGAASRIHKRTSHITVVVNQSS